MYEQIASNKRKSFFVCFVFLILIGALGWVFAALTRIGWYWGVGIAVLVALAMTRMLDRSSGSYRDSRSS